MQAISQARDVVFEESLYAGAADGTLTGASSINALFDTIGTRYSIWHGLDPELQRQWMRIPHYFRSPFYRVNYLYARLLAIRYFDMYRRDPAGFVPRFLGLLRAGYSAPPAELLKRHLDIRLDGPELVRDATRMLEEQLLELESRYAH
jgi:oligoendopeptidase F